MNSPKKTSNKFNFTEKKCPECLAHLRLDVTKCPECGIKIGEVDKFGLAKRPFNWKAYLSFLVALGLFAAYIWKTFF